MNKQDPEHWNRNLKLTHEAPNELLQALQGLKELGEKRKAALEQGEDVIEGESRVLPWEE